MMVVVLLLQMILNVDLNFGTGIELDDSGVIDNECAVVCRWWWCCPCCWWWW